MIPTMSSKVSEQAPGVSDDRLGEMLAELYSEMTAYARTRARRDAEDIVSIATERFWRSRSMYWGGDDLAALKRYIYSIIRNCAIDQYRADKRRANASNSTDFPGFSLSSACTDLSAQHELEIVEDRLYLDEVLKAFSPREADIASTLLEGYTMAEVARLLHTSRVNVFRCVTRIRQRLGRVMEGKQWAAM